MYALDLDSYPLLHAIRADLLDCLGPNGRGGAGLRGGSWTYDERGHTQISETAAATPQPISTAARILCPFPLEHEAQHDLMLEGLRASRHKMPARIRAGITCSRSGPYRFSPK